MQIVLLQKLTCICKTCLPEEAAQQEHNLTKLQTISAPYRVGIPPLQHVSRTALGNKDKMFMLTSTTEVQVIRCKKNIRKPENFQYIFKSTYA
jgi:hypothetical protein